MARYIDAEQFRGKHEVAEVNGKLSSVILYADIVYAPTADVVPKSEVEKLIGKFECFLCHATGSRLSKHTYDLRTMETIATDYINETYNDGYGEGYKDCAKEIFTEIEAEITEALKCNYKRRTEYYTKERYEKEDREFISAVNGKIDALRGIEGFIDELKKKYTEGKQ